MPRPGALAAAALVAVLAVSVAAPSLRYGFVYDDEAVVLQRKPFWEFGLREFLESRPWGTGRHLTALSLDADRLAQGTVPLARLARDSGFSDQAHLTRWFSRVLGITPGRYAAALRRERTRLPLPAR